MDPSLQRWLEANPFLVPLASFQAAVAGAAAAIPSAAPQLPPFDACAEDVAAGVPLLRTRSHGPPLRAAGAGALGALAAATATLELPKAIAEGLAELRAGLAAPGAPAAAVEWLVGGDPEAPGPPQPGLARFVGWTALGRVLAPLLGPWEAWRGPGRWHRSECPTCGALPVMAQLVAREAGRDRVLACGCCATRWGYKRIGCPFCGNEAEARLAILELEGPAGLRLDVCESCQGYLKTYAGQGEEALFLADWPTLVLDTMAAERGYHRRGASLFEL